MRVLQVSCGGLGNGGVQSVIMNICRNLNPGSCDIILFTNEKRFYDDEFLSLGGNIFRISKFEGDSKLSRKFGLVWNAFKIFFGTIEILNKNKPYDVIHCHSLLESAICNLAAKIYKVRVRISHAHTSVELKKNGGLIKHYYQFLLRKFVVLGSNYFLSCSEEALINTFGKDIFKSTYNYIVKDKTTADKNEIKLKFKKWMKQNPYHTTREWVYKDVTPRIIIEELLDNNGKEPIDYKFYCFDGYVHCCKIQYFVEGMKFQKYVNLNYEDLKVVDDSYMPYSGGFPVIPNYYQDMILRAQLMSKGFKHVRIDFLGIEKCYYVGEMTFFTSAGYDNFVPDSFDYEMGKLIKF